MFTTNLELALAFAAVITWIYVIAQLVEQTSRGLAGA